MKKIILSTVVAAAMLSTGSAFAGGGSLFGGSDESSMAAGALYGGASIGQATYRCTTTDEDCDSDGWKILAGYKLNQNMAIEGAYYNLGEDTAEYEHATYGTMKASAKSTGIGVTGIYTQPVADNLEVFGKLGAMFWNVEGELSQNVSGAKVSATDEEDGTSVLFGLGASYKFDDNWGIRGEWERYTAEYEDMDKAEDSEEDIDILSAGVTFSTY